MGCHRRDYRPRDPVKPMMRKEPSRHYFSFQVGGISRFWGVLLLVSSLVAIAILRTPVAVVIFGMSTLGALYGLLRPAKPGFFVDLATEHLTINVMTVVKIPYEDIASADFYRYRDGKFVRALQNLAIGLSRIVGGQFPYVGQPGEVDKGVVELKFNGWKWLYFPVPPFLIPRKSWLLRVDDAASLRSQIRQRLSART